MKNLWLTAGLVASLTGSAFAQSTSATLPSQPVQPGQPAMTGTSTASNKASGLKSITDNISVSTLSYLYGPFVSDPGSKVVSDDSIGSTMGLSSRHQLAVKYRLSDNITIAPTLDFDWSFTNADGRTQRTFTWRDSYVKMSVGQIATADLGGNDFVVAGDLRLFVPSSKSSRDNNTLGGIRASINPAIQFGKSAWSLSTVNFARFWLQQEEKSATGGTMPALQLYTGPQVNYQVNDAVTAFVLYETTVVYNNQGIPNTTNADASLADIEPGADIKINDRITLSPYLNWYTNQRLSTTTMNLALGITLL